jgi:hypothetical protein
MPILAERTQVAIKQEATAGTVETLAAANVILTTELPTWSAEPEIKERSALSASFASRGHVIGSRMAKISFKMFLRGTTGAPVDPTNLPDFTVPFRGCGLTAVVSGTGPNEITTFTPVSSFYSDETTGPYCTVAVYRDGKRYMIHGAVGTLKLTFNVGEPVLAEMEFTGIYNAPTDTALLVPSYPVVIEPPFLGATLSILGFTTAKIKSLTVDLGNRITMRPQPNLNGFYTAQLTGRKVTGAFDPEEELAATKNWFTEWIGATPGAISTGTYPSNGSNYNQFSLSLPKVQYSKVGLEERDAIATAPTEYVALANSDAGDDEISFVQT